MQALAYVNVELRMQVKTFVNLRMQALAFVKNLAELAIVKLSILNSKNIKTLAVTVNINLLLSIKQ